MKTALVYDRINKWGGAERDLLALHELFPDAPLYTSVYKPNTANWAKVFSKVIPSFLNKISFVSDKHELFPYLMPLAFETFNFDAYDAVISVTSEAAKGIITSPKTLHICYCLTPTRYLWSHYDLYFKDKLFKRISRPVVEYLRGWDKIAAQRPDIMVAQSRAVGKRIKKYYGRDSTLIHPPADVDFFGRRQKGKRGNFFLIVSRLVPYKRVDLAIKAFNILGSPLYIVGVGSEEGRLKAMANKNVHFLGKLTDEKLAHYYRKCAAFILPQEEDFGLAAVEAQLGGAPVIAYRAGGALDIVVEGKSGLFFDTQNTNEIIAAVDRFRISKFNYDVISQGAKRFSKEVFKEKFKKLLQENGRV